MKFFLLSDNVDTVTGMRLAAIEGVVVHKAEETEKAEHSRLRLRQKMTRKEKGDR